MIQKKILILILCCMVISCGKKESPIYKESKKNIEVKKILINKA
jgi:hypothetical protein